MDVLNDYELLYLVRQNCEVALNLLYEKYEKMLWSIIHAQTKQYTHLGMERDDFMQYASISFFQSISSYREDRSASFSTFMYICVERKIKTIVRNMFRGNNLLFLESASMDEEIHNAEHISLIETIENPYPEYCPVWNLNLKEEVDVMDRYFGQMKPVDKDIFALWRNGYSYREIASEYELDPKYIDNTIQKIKRLYNKYKITS